jgi:hypothetical protein
MIDSCVIQKSTCHNDTDFTKKKSENHTRTPNYSPHFTQNPPSQNTPSTIHRLKKSRQYCSILYREEWKNRKMAPSHGAQARRAMAGNLLEMLDRVSGLKLKTGFPLFCWKIVKRTWQGFRITSHTQGL